MRHSVTLQELERLLKAKVERRPGAEQILICDNQVFLSHLPATIETLGLPVSISPASEGVVLAFLDDDGATQLILIRTQDHDPILAALDVEVKRVRALFQN